MMNKQELQEYNSNGEKLRQHFQKTVGRFLLEERIRRNISLGEISQKSGIKPKRIEDFEFAKNKLRWCIVARLLKLYKKTLKISLVDIPQQDETN